MMALRTVCLFVLGVLLLSSEIASVTALNYGSSPGRAIAKTKYSTSHSLGDSYMFDPRDGWQSFNASNMLYKYRRDSKTNHKTTKHKAAANHKEASKIAQKGTTLGVDVLKGVKDLFKGLVAIGSPEPVTATWYTGHDLQNPSCWSNTKWAPTDASFVCALTLQGWNSKPQCFKFLELCNTPKKCVFVRVVDTCAGCAVASHHVDLTRAPFGKLADFDTGVMTVQSRVASEPDDWYEDLWGPKN
ncbi:Non-catalytic module family EXPN protein [Mycena rebaudengoi]|nr:Non-catalytic module family EXPN protein [Mycena rebaudengoi]